MERIREGVRHANRHDDDRTRVNIDVFIATGEPHLARGDDEDLFVFMVYVLRRLCQASGRNPRTIRRSLYCPSSMKPSPWASVEAFHDMVGHYREAGIEEFVIDLTNVKQFSVLQRIAIDAIPALKGERAVT